MNQFNYYIKRILSLLAILILTSSCVTNYYFVNIEEDTPIYKNKNVESTSIVVIPKGYGAYISSNKSKYKRVKWQNYKGWTSNPIYSVHNSDYKKSDKSYKNNFNSKSSSGGPVQVKGYYRKNGTYVKPHTRSAPKRR